MSAEDLIYSLYSFYEVNNNLDLAEKLKTTPQTISNWKTRNSVSAIKKKCRELGIYQEIFGDINTNNNLQKSTFSGNSTGIDNSNNKSIYSDKESDIECDAFTMTLIKQMCDVYKDNQLDLQKKLFELIQDANANK